MALGEFDSIRATSRNAVAPWNELALRPALVGLVLLAVLLLYAPTVRSLTSVWANSATFTHGFLVLPVSAWFVWMRRRTLLSIPAQPCWPAFVITVAAGLVWTIGDLSASQGLTHFALVVLFISVVIAIFGLGWTRALAFPLAFLLLAVPFGEDSVPTLMDWTADFTVGALKLSGVPVLREGNDFTIPSGRWSVVEACSGARYLLASFVVGTLYAWLMYRSPLRRTVFMAVSLLAPIVANWVRAYMIVMLGHLSNNTLAAGVDHLIYGWVFFGIVIFAIFAAGARWREDDEQDGRAEAAGDTREVDFRRLWPAALAALVITSVWPALSAALVTTSDKRPVRPVDVQPAAGWVSAPERPRWQLRLEQPRAVIVESFKKDARRVQLQVGVYRDQRQGSELISAQNQLGVTLPVGWRQVDRTTRKIQHAGRDAVVTSALARDVSGTRYMRVWQWYWLDPLWTASDARAKLQLALDRLLLRSDTSAWISVSTEHDPEQPLGAESLLREFLAEMGPSIDAALTATTYQ
jgi:exosortase A